MNAKTNFKRLFSISSSIPSGSYYIPILNQADHLEPWFLSKNRDISGFFSKQNLVNCDDAVFKRKFVRDGSFKEKAGAPKILLFKNIFNSDNKEKNRWFSSGMLYLISSLREKGFNVILSDSRISLEDNGFITNLVDLNRILSENKDLNFIGFSLCEDFFDKAGRLVEFLRSRSNALIGVGGVMPTLNPQHVFVHLKNINFLVRGAGEEIFPKLVTILGKSYNDALLTNEQVKKVLELKGLLFRNKSIFICSSIDKINNLNNYDNSIIDFSFLKKEHVTEGLNLFVSRGCFNSCFFCTTPGRGNYIGKSFDNLLGIVRNYYVRLSRLFNRRIPGYALKISFNDDDFLADAKRAAMFFRFIKEQPLRIGFFQTGINSFFLRFNGKSSNVLNEQMLQELTSDVFAKERGTIYIGTENFSDTELARMNKGYGFKKIKAIVKLLSEKRIYQLHHFIVSNHLTTPEEILDNLIKIASLRLLYGDYFKILTPVIPYLVSLYPSVSYKIAMSNSRDKFLNIRKVLSVDGYPEYDYPLVQNDIPINALTRELVPLLNDLFLEEKDYLIILDRSLISLLIMKETKLNGSKELGKLIDKYKNYPKLISKSVGIDILNDRSSLQVMITRRCQLRCKYCPVVKKNQDISEKNLFKGIDLLFTSSRDVLRLDFTGGEPLLRFDLVRKGVEYAKKIASRKNKVISFYMVTNLIALNDEIAEFLEKENFLLELSLDGEEKFHNLCKVPYDKRINPYAVTTGQLSKILSKRINNYAVLVTTPATVKFLYRNFCHLLSMGIRRVGVNYAIGVQWDSLSQKEFFLQLDLIKEKFSTLIKNGIIQLGNLGPRVEPAILNSEIMVDVDGEVHFLTDWLFERVVKTKAPPIGKVSSLKNLNKINLTKFLILDRMFKYSPNLIRKIIVNNVQMGYSCKKYFDKWKKQ